MFKPIPMDNFYNAFDDLEDMLKTNDIELITIWASRFAYFSKYSEHAFPDKLLRLEILMHSGNAGDHNHYCEHLSDDGLVTTRYCFKISEIVEARNSLRRFLNLKVFL